MARKSKKMHVIAGKPQVLKLAKQTTSSGFMSGGAIAARKDGGMVGGEASMERADKRARGGRTSGAPFSSAHASSMHTGSSKSGHEGE